MLKDSGCSMTQGVSNMPQSAIGVPKKEWSRPVLRKLPVAETSTKAKGNEGTGGGKGENTIIS
jgi:hypothetical protein